MVGLAVRRPNLPKRVRVLHRCLCVVSSSLVVQPTWCHFGPNCCATLPFALGGSFSRATLNAYRLRILALFKYTDRPVLCHGASEPINVYQNILGKPRIGGRRRTTAGLAPGTRDRPRSSPGWPGRQGADFVALAAYQVAGNPLRMSESAKRRAGGRPDELPGQRSRAAWTASEHQAPLRPLA